MTTSLKLTEKKETTKKPVNHVYRSENRPFYYLIIIETNKAVYQVSHFLRPSSGRFPFKFSQYFRDACFPFPSGSVLQSFYILMATFLNKPVYRGVNDGYLLFYREWRELRLFKDSTLRAPLSITRSWQHRITTEFRECLLTVSAWSNFKGTSQLFIDLIWALPPTRLTEIPTLIAGRIPALNGLFQGNICPSVIEITLGGDIGRYVTSLCFDDGNAVNEPPPLPGVWWKQARSFICFAISSLAIFSQLFPANGYAGRIRHRGYASPGRTTEQQRNLTVSHRLFWKIIINDQCRTSGITEILTDSCTCKRSVELKRSGIRSRSGNDGCISHRSVLFEFFMIPAMVLSDRSQHICNKPVYRQHKILSGWWWYQ